MYDIRSMISMFSDDEKQGFINYLEKKNKRSNVKNIQLFKLLAKNDLSSKEVYTSLYDGKQTGAYHALRSRLYHSIIDYLAGISLDEENSEKMLIIKFILVSRTFLEQQNYRTAFKILSKAETIAKEYQLFPYLNEIYHIKIQYAHSFSEVKLDTLIKTFKRNQKQYFLEEELNIVYAKIRQTLNQAVFESKVVDFQKILEKSLKAHNINFNDSLSLKSLYQLLTIASISAFFTKDYLQIESFALKTHELVKHNDNRIQSFYHIQILYMIANMFFRNKKFEMSLQYLELMHSKMTQNRRRYYNRFKLKYTLLTALNYNYSNKQNKAISYLIDLIHKKHQDLESLLDMHLSLIVFYFQKNELKKAHSLLSKFYHTDKWYMKKAGKEWVIKKNLVEILLHLELENLSLFESRLLSFRRQYSSYLKEINQERVLTFLKLIEWYYHNPQIVTTKEFHTKVKKSFVWIDARREDIFVMSFYAWLKGKMENKPLYTTTLELIEKAKAIKRPYL